MVCSFFSFFLLKNVEFFGLLVFLLSCIYHLCDIIYLGVFISPTKRSKPSIQYIKRDDRKVLSSILFKLAFRHHSKNQKRKRKEKSCLPLGYPQSILYITPPTLSYLFIFLSHFFICFSFFLSFFLLYPSCWIFMHTSSHRPHELKPKTKRPLSFLRLKSICELIETISVCFSSLLKQLTQP